MSPDESCAAGVLTYSIDVSIEDVSSSRDDVIVFVSLPHVRCAACCSDALELNIVIVNIVISSFVFKRRRSGPTLVNENDG